MVVDMFSEALQPGYHNGNLTGLQGMYDTTRTPVSDNHSGAMHCGLVLVLVQKGNGYKTSWRHRGVPMLEQARLVLEVSKSVIKPLDESYERLLGVTQGGQNCKWSQHKFP